MRNNFQQNRGPRGPERDRNAWAGRNNNGPRRPPSVPRAQRSVRAINLGRVAAEVERDVLACALEVTEQVLISLIEGSENANDAQYATHLSHRLEDMGFSMSWLDTPDITISPAQVKTLKEFAAQSVTRKGPTRRSNFKKLVQAFSSQVGVLSDALELIESSVRSIADGRLDFDEQRFSHVNPRLMQAGFPNGWLEKPDAELTPEMIDSLVSLATDDYERTLEEANSTAVESVPVVQDSGMASLVDVTAATSEPSTEADVGQHDEQLVMALPLPDEVEPEALAEESITTVPTLVVPEVVLPASLAPIDETAGSVSDEVVVQETVVVEAAAQETAAVSTVIEDTAEPEQVVNINVAPVVQEEMEQTTMQTETTNTEALTENNSTSEAAPASAPAVLTRGARDVGRAIVFPQSGPSVTVKQRKPMELPEGASSTESLVGMPPPRFPGSTVPAVEPEAPAVHQPRVFTAAPTSHQVEEAQTTIPVVSALVATVSQVETKEQATLKSIQRAQNLDKLMADARRGAKVILWRDLMGRGLPFWNNVKRGAVRFKDDLAANVEAALGLPAGWLDAPTYPPATLAAWVMDKNAAVPGLQYQPTETEPSEDDLKVTPFAREELAPVSIEMEELAPAMSATPVTASLQADAIAVAPAVVASPIVVPTPPVAVAMPEQQREATTTQLKEHSHPVAGSLKLFTHQKPINPVARTAPGPVAQAVMATLADLSMKGELSEQDALRLLTHLMTEFAV